MAASLLAAAMLFFVSHLFVLDRTMPVGNEIEMTERSAPRWAEGLNWVFNQNNPARSAKAR